MDNFLNCCKKLKIISLSNCNKEISVSMDCFFSYCGNLETIDLSNFKAKIISVKLMFNNCRNLTKVDLSGFVTTNESQLAQMFDYVTDESSFLILIAKDKNIFKEYDERKYAYEGVAEEGGEYGEGEGDEECEAEGEAYPA